MAALNPGHGKTGTSVTSSSPAIPQAQVLARHHATADNAKVSRSQTTAPGARPDIVHAHQITRHTSGSGPLTGQGGHHAPSDNATARRRAHPRDDR